MTRVSVPAQCPGRAIRCRGRSRRCTCRSSGTRRLPLPQSLRDFGFLAAALPPRFGQRECLGEREVGDSARLRDLEDAVVELRLLGAAPAFGIEVSPTPPCWCPRSSRSGCPGRVEFHERSCPGSLIFTLPRLGRHDDLVHDRRRLLAVTTGGGGVNTGGVDDRRRGRLRERARSRSAAPRRPPRRRRRRRCRSGCAAPPAGRCRRMHGVTNPLAAPPGGDGQDVGVPTAVDQLGAQAWVARDLEKQPLVREVRQVVVVDGCPDAVRDVVPPRRFSATSDP